MLKRILRGMLLTVFIISLASLSYASDTEVLLKTLLNKGVINKSEYRKLRRDLRRSDTETLEQRVTDIEERTKNLGKISKLEQKVSEIEKKTNKPGKTDTLEQRVADIEKKTKDLDKTEILQQSKTEIEQLEQRVARIETNTTTETKADDKEEETSLPGWSDRITISGTVEGDFSHVDKNDFRDKDSDSASDLFVGTAELGVEAEITDWITGGILFLAEDLGTVDETDVAVDEAVLTLAKEGFPLYAVYGKRALPFGVYENHLISDPMTADAYETGRAGLTVGVTGPTGLDLSATAYNGDEMITHLFESGLFETDDEAEFFTRDATENNDITSYILSGSVSPISDHLTLFASFLSEKGNGERNESIALAIDYNCMIIEGLLIDAEYIFANSREEYTSNNGVTDTFKENVLSATVAYVFGGDERGEPGTTYLVRRAHLFAEPLEIAVRYEKFDDDKMAKRTQTWSVKNRYSAGIRYSFYEDEELGVAAFGALEYKKTEYEISSALEDSAADDSNEIMAKLGVSF